MTRYTIYYYEIILLMTFALFCVGKKNPLISLLCFFMFLREILIYICGIHFYYFTRLLIFFVYFSLIRMIYCFILISVNFQLFESKSLIIYKPNSRIYIRLSFICLLSFCFIFWYSYNHLSPLLSHKTMLNNDFNSALLYGAPFKRISPWTTVLTSKRQANVFKRVDLPEPDGPAFYDDI